MFTLMLTFQKLAQMKRHVNCWRQVLTCKHTPKHKEVGLREIFQINSLETFVSRKMLPRCAPSLSGVFMNVSRATCQFLSVI